MLVPGGIVQLKSSTCIVLFVSEGVGRGGFGQTIVPLVHGLRYFASVRAVTGAGNVLDSGSSGVTLDLTPPEVYVTGIGIISGNDTEHIDAIYQTSESMSASWKVEEEESDVAASTFYVGSYPGSDNIYQETFALNLTSLPNGVVTAESGGGANILSVQGCNEVSSPQLPVLQL